MPEVSIPYAVQEIQPAGGEDRAMSDDLGKKIQQIAELLGQDTVPDNVKELVTLIAGSLTSKEGAADTTAAPVDELPEKAEDNNPADNSELMNTARKALSKINSGNDPRINLLHAIKPFMNSKRQKKIGNCIQLLQVASLSKLFNEPENKSR